MATHANGGRGLYWPVAFRYRGAILDDLCSHGIRPNSVTDPAFVREYLSDLYRYEIRHLKARLIRGEFPRGDYARRVKDLRNEYFLLAIPLTEWVEADLNH
jgi:hypothetical protein